MQQKILDKNKKMEPPLLQDLSIADSGTDASETWTQID